MREGGKEVIQHPPKCGGREEWVSIPSGKRKGRHALPRRGLGKGRGGKGQLGDSVALPDTSRRKSCHETHENCLGVFV